MRYFSCIQEYSVSDTGVFQHLLPSLPIHLASSVMKVLAEVLDRDIAPLLHTLTSTPPHTPPQVRILTSTPPHTPLQVHILTTSHTSSVCYLY